MLVSPRTLRYLSDRRRLFEHCLDDRFVCCIECSGYSILTVKRLSVIDLAVCLSCDGEWQCVVDLDDVVTGCNCYCLRRIIAVDCQIFLEILSLRCCSKCAADLLICECICLECLFFSEEVVLYCNLSLGVVEVKLEYCASVCCYCC